MWWITLVLLRSFIARPTGAAIRGPDTRAATVGPSLEPMIVEIGLNSGSSRRDFGEVSLVDHFMRLCQHLGVPSFV